MYPIYKTITCFQDSKLGGLVMARNFESLEYLVCPYRLIVKQVIGNDQPLERNQLGAPCFFTYLIFTII
ncbi:uncharacterized protein METZ01_LOCUS179260 [marine metagenome]|uniref:Uncharacterized protein n=1 Tax=marine metagenome TaxID=408172 RepID=A0A382CJV0_9ZZZZ